MFSFIINRYKPFFGYKAGQIFSIRSQMKRISVFGVMFHYPVFLHRKFIETNIGRQPETIVTGILNIMNDITRLYIIDTFVEPE